MPIVFKVGSVRDLPSLGKLSFFYGSKKIALNNVNVFRFCLCHEQDFESSSKS